MKRKLLLAAMGFLCMINYSFAQSNVFNPNDPVNNYNPSSPPAAPANTLLKWVRTPRPEMALWNFNTDQFKPYYFNGMPFRLRYPNGYNPADVATKYPIIVFFHGAGEIAPVTDNEIQLYWGAQKFETMINAGQFNAFLFFPTTQVQDWSPAFPNVNKVLDSLQKYLNINQDRLITMGLSLGGDGTMKYTFAFPQRSAISIAASPGSIPTFLTIDPTPHVHIPFWVSSGGTDILSPPASVQTFVNTFTNAGGDIRWSYFPFLGHGTWNEQWAEPYLLPYWQAAHKANPLVFFKQTQLPAPINARIGITAGYAQYQWQKDNVDISGATSNEIIATAPGSYRVRFKRTAASNFSDWSPNPAVITQTGGSDNTPPTTPGNLHVVTSSNNAVDLDWDNSTDAGGMAGYDVYVDGVLRYTSTTSDISANGLLPNTSYSFTVKARDLSGNTSAFSNAVNGTTTNTGSSSGLNYRYYEGTWTALPNFNTLTPIKTGTTPNIDLSVRTPGRNDNFAFVWEGSINIPTAGSYIFETLSDDGSKFYFNTTYSPGATALVNNDGLHGAFTPATGSVNIPAAGIYPIAITYFEAGGGESMQLFWTGPGITRQLIPNSAFTSTPPIPDNTPPTTPGNLHVVTSSNNAVDLDWDNSTDLGGMAGYDVYVDGVQRYTSTTSDISANALLPNTSYSFTVKARDLAGNTSPFSNAVIGTTTNTGSSSGLNYRYYEGTWTALPNFNTLTPINTGTTPNIDLSVRTPGRNDNFAFVWEGSINIPTAGSYIFETLSDDGSKFYFNTTYSPGATALVNNDGLHGAFNAVAGTVNIPAAGIYPIAITYFEAGGGESMQLFWTGPGITRQLIPNSAFTSTPPTPDNTAPSTPGNLHVVSSSNNAVNLDWDNSTDNVGVTGYDVYVDGILKYTTTTSDISAGTLLPNTSYSFTVKARDLAGNASAFSNAVIGTTTNTGSSSGLNYRYYEGIWTALPNFNSLTPVKTGTTPNIDLSVRTPGRNDNFAFVWEGSINIPTAGNYIFETLSDDGSKFYFNSSYSPTATALVNNDGLHGAWAPVVGNVNIATAGAYPIAITYFEAGGGESMQLYWTGPGITRQLVPNSAFTTGTPPPPPPTSGLAYKYYEGTWTALPNFNSLTPIKTGTSPNIDLNERTPGRNDNFAFLWEGNIIIPTAGTYTFETLSDDGSKFYFNTTYSPGATAVVNNDGLHGAWSPVAGNVNIPAAGVYPIAISYFEAGGGESMQVFWTGPGIVRQLIPNSAFTQPIPPIMIGSSPMTNTDRSNNPGGVLGDSRNGTPQITQVYPNPFSGSFNIGFFNSAPTNKISVGIYDMAGRQLLNHYFGNVAAGNRTLKTDISSKKLPAGIYFVAVQINGVRSKMVKLVKY